LFVGKFLHQMGCLLQRARVDFTVTANGLGFTQQVLNCAFDLLIQLGRVDFILIYNVFAKRRGNLPIHPFREMRAQIGPIEQRLLKRRFSI
jgi:hypothetical protein